ncbi:MAG: M20/M25/M40 family metallo-hydrolase [Candidatus Peregrinibacteria bacterium]|nr:M20/M25/M40 family metallo-hydrolase [Candidatus Peregrinibacteria bacterium]
MQKFRTVEGGLNEDDLRDLAGMVELPSWVDPERKIDESALAEFISGKLKAAGCNVWMMPAIEGKRQNVIAEKGSGEKVVWIMGHMDTNEPDPRWDIGCKFEQSPSGDILQGVGVWDMKVGLLQMLKLARLDVPAGLKYIFIFLVDEELDSQGIDQVIQAFPPPLGVYSPGEIPTTALPELLMGGRRHPIVTARKGHAKLKATVEAPSGHGSGEGVPNAIAACRELMNNYFQRVYEMIQNAPFHPLLGKPHITETDIRTVRRKRKYHSNANMVKLQLSHMLTPPMTLEKAEQFHKDVFEKLTKQCKFEAHRISAAIRLAKPELACYEAYEMPTGKGFIQALASSVDRVHGKYGVKHVFVGGNSTSDMSRIAEKGYIGAETAGEGGNEHSDHEWTTSRSAQDTYEVGKAFLTEEIPKALNEGKM